MMVRKRTERSGIRKFSLRSILFVNLASTPVVFFTPAHPFGKATANLDEITVAQVQKINETSKIYSILTSAWTDLSEMAGWSIASAILTESHRYSLDPMLVLAVIHVESSFLPTAVSTAGARGLMQILPFVGRGLAEEARLDGWEDEASLTDPILNIKLGIYYLAQLKKSFRDLKLALTAYNLGPTNLRQRLQEGEEIPFTYAKKVFSIHHVYTKQKVQSETGLPVHWGKDNV